MRISILVRSCVHTGPALPQALKPTNLAHNLPPYFIMIRFHITLSSMPRSSHCCFPSRHSTDVSGKHFLWTKSCTTSMMPLRDVLENTTTPIFLQFWCNIPTEWNGLSRWQPIKLRNRSFLYNIRDSLSKIYKKSCGQWIVSAYLKYFNFSRNPLAPVGFSPIFFRISCRSRILHVQSLTTVLGHTICLKTL